MPYILPENRESYIPHLATINNYLLNSGCIVDVSTLLCRILIRQDFGFYHDKDLTNALNSVIDSLVKREESGKDILGDLNYVVTSIIVHYLKLVDSPKYFKFVYANNILRRIESIIYRRSFQNNDYYFNVLATIDCIKMEIYRRWAAPYEDSKIKSNGDI